MDVLKKGADEATKAIGTGLVDALSMLGKDDSIKNAAEQMENFGTAIGNVIAGLAELIRRSDKLIAVNNEGKLGDILARLQPGGDAARRALGLLSNFGANARASASPSLNNANARENRLQLAQIKTGTTYRKLENAQLKAKTEIDKLSEKFDLERIGLMKALGEATDAETKLRIQAKIAILDNNEALAKKYNAELAASAAAKTLADSATNAANALNTLPSKYDAIFTSLVNTFKTMGLDQGSAAGLAGASARLQAQADAFLAQMSQYAVPGQLPSAATTAAAAAAPTAVPQVTVNTGAVLSSNQDLERYIQDALGNITKLGNGALVPAGSIAFA
jgi:hypothetical protein